MMAAQLNSSMEDNPREAFASSIRKWLETNRLEDLDRCIADGLKLLDTLDPEKSGHGMVAIELCSLMGLRWSRTKSDETWTEGLKVALHWRNLIPPPDWRAPLYVLGHGILLYRRAQVTEAADDIATAIDTLEDARRLVKLGSGVHGTSSAYLADLRQRRFAKYGEPIDLESSIYDATCVIHSNRALPADQCLAGRALAQAYLGRYDRIHSPGDLEKAIEAVKFALERKPNPYLAGSVWATLGSALRHRFLSKHDLCDLDEAIAAYETALQNQVHDPENSGVSTDNLGNCYAERYKLKKVSSDLDEAIACSYRALTLLPADANDRANVHANLGFSLIDRGRDRNDLPALDEALALFRAGLDFDYIPQAVTVRLHNGIAEALLVADVLHHRTEHLDEAIAALEKSFSTGLAGEADLPVPYRLGRRGAIKTISSRLVGALLLRATQNTRGMEADLWRAIAIGEAGKVVLLTQELLRRSLPPPDGVSERLIQSEAVLLARLAALDAREISPSPTDTAAAQLRRIIQRSEIRTRLELAWREIASASPAGKGYVEMRQELPTALLKALELRSPTRVLVSILETEQLASDGTWRSGLSLLVLYPDKAGPEIVFSVADNPFREVKARLAAEVIEDRGRGTCAETWWQALANAIRRNDLGVPGTIVVSLSESGVGLPWQLVFERAGWCEPDGTPRPVIIVPSFALMAASKSPLKIDWQELKNGSEDLNIPGEVLVTNASNTYWVEALHDVSAVWFRDENMPRLPLVVGNPSSDLDSASIEAVKVAAILGVKALLGPEATIAAVETGFGKSSVVHIAAHAQFDTDDPLESSIRLADGELKACQLIGEWSTASLVVLSACESGADRPGLGGELLGFATALLRSGVQTVVASLWAVDDAATRTLMTKLHEAIVHGIPAPKALINAMMHVRRQPGWDLPYYWAPFVALSQRLE